jgi:hypothetical protein
MAPVPTVAQLLRGYPEFSGAEPDFTALLEEKLLEAAAETSDWVFPSSRAQLSYTLMKAAVLLYNSPYAREMRLDVANGPKTKDMERLLFRKAQAATLGIRVF